MKTLYLDIDGVLVDSKERKAAENGKEFINFIVNNFDCYWLSTRCKGETELAMNYLSMFYDSETMELLKTINPTEWGAMKTDAIEMTDEWYWLDDAPLSFEVNILKKYGLLNRLIVVDLSKDYGLNGVKLKLEKVKN
ncbi:MAG: hypothetical protein Q8880_00455 [Bacteroidota bacterium]|nr:hypothetical protein [Bacteroidota bacterium]